MTQHFGTLQDWTCRSGDHHDLCDRGVVFEGSIATDSDAIAGALAPYAPGCVGLEAGPMSEWLHTGLTRHDLETVLMETRRVRAALKASQVKTDRRDAHGIAQLLLPRSTDHRDTDLQIGTARR